MSALNLDGRVAMSRDQSDDDGPNHIVCVCCAPDLALCGTDMTGRDWVTDDDADPWCVVCDDLDETPCPRCGCTGCP